MLEINIQQFNQAVKGLDLFRVKSSKKDDTLTIFGALILSRDEFECLPELKIKASGKFYDIKWLDVVTPQLARQHPNGLNSKKARFSSNGVPISDSTYSLVLKNASNDAFVEIARVTISEAHEAKAISAIKNIRETLELEIKQKTKPSSAIWRKLKRQLLSMNLEIQRSSEWKEAVILSLIGGKTRPRLAYRYMNQLQKIYKKNGLLEEFEHFKNKVNDFLSPSIITQHGYSFSLADKDTKAIFKGLRAIPDKLSAVLGEPYEVFVNSGTLLGIVRDGRLIEHDDDIDLGIFLNASSVEEAALEWAKIVNCLREEGLSISNLEPSIKLLPLDGVQVDLFPCWAENEKIYIWPYSFGVLSKEDLFPLVRSEDGLNRPNNAEKFLEINYGKSWRTPDPYFMFEWRPAFRKFSKFMELINYRK